MYRVVRTLSIGIISQNNIYKSLDQVGNPSFETVVKVMGSLGFGLRPASVS